MIPSAPPQYVIFVVDDDADIRNMIVTQLRKEGYAATGIPDLGLLATSLAAATPDLIVLDLNLPDGDGLIFCQTARAQGYAGAIIIVTARDTGIQRALGLELGADDYLVKPFEPRELSVRVRNLLRRGGTRPHTEPRFARIGPWRLDLLQRHLLTPDDRLVMLSSAEFRLLSRFIQAPNIVLGREALLPERHATVAFDRSIDLQISRLRQKLAATGVTDRLIVTMRNEGYVLATTVSYE